MSFLTSGPRNKPDSLVFIIVAIMLIVVGIATTATISTVKTRQNQGDIRARASSETANALKFSGIVKEVHEAEGFIVVDNVALSADSRSGEEKNYGTWNVAPPTQFSMQSVKPGDKVLYSVETSTFNVASKSVAAILMTVESR